MTAVTLCKLKTRFTASLHPPLKVRSTYSTSWNCDEKAGRGHLAALPPERLVGRELPAAPGGVEQCHRDVPVAMPVGRTSGCLCILTPEDSMTEAAAEDTNALFVILDTWFYKVTADLNTDALLGFVSLKPSSGGTAQLLNNAVALEQEKLQSHQQNDGFIPGAVTMLMFTSRE